MLLVQYLAHGKRCAHSGGLAATTVGEDVPVISVPSTRQGGAGRETKHVKCGQRWLTPAVRCVFVLCAAASFRRPWVPSRPFSNSRIKNRIE